MASNNLIFPIFGIHGEYRFKVAAIIINRTVLIASGMKGLKKYLQNRENVIDFLLKKPVRYFTPSTFHKLRVEIKKLNAFFELIDFCIKDFKRNKTFKPLKQIFRQAGKVREIQVEEALLKKYSPDNLLIGYRKKLRIRRLKERQAFFALINESSTARLKKTFSDIVPYLTRMDENKLNSYLEKKRNKIKEHLIRCELKPDQIHELRKLLKSYYYNRNTIVPGNKKAISVKLVDLSDLLGKWHDCQLIYRHLEKVITEVGIVPEDLAQIEHIKTMISSENELLLGKIKTAISASEFME